MPRTASSVAISRSAHSEPAAAGLGAGALQAGAVDAGEARTAAPHVRVAHAVAADTAEAHTAAPQAMALHAEAQNMVAAQPAAVCMQAASSAVAHAAVDFIRGEGNSPSNRDTPGGISLWELAQAAATALEPTVGVAHGAIDAAAGTVMQARALPKVPPMAVRAKVGRNASLECLPTDIQLSVDARQQLLKDAVGKANQAMRDGQAASSAAQRDLCSQTATVARQQARIAACHWAWAKDHRQAVRDLMQGMGVT